MSYSKLIRELTRPQCLEPNLFARLTSDVFSRQPATDICGGEHEREGMEINEQGLAIIPIRGFLARNLDGFKLMGMVDYNEIQAEILEANEQGARAIVLDIESGGGSVSGVYETGRMIRNSEIPTIAFVNDYAYSAAYWLASQCDSIVAMPTSGVGSVGIYLPPIYDVSKALSAQGVDVHFVHAGEFKASGAFPAVGITAEQLSELQRSADNIHGIFKQEIKYRLNILDNLLEGQKFSGLEGLQFGFVDVIVDNIYEFARTAEDLLR